MIKETTQSGGKIKTTQANEKKRNGVVQAQVISKLSPQAVH